eukprot:CAMPEP_0184479750 /NCGR_PEP_ID=MMETSP0113_2-20130426/1350_1 /TAXON_ID=91329 /ORGANISM="Norrisiella sphaerica, Strain BC52" /LENGTH=53 /DNA_ID=CAMNT_0026857891 /DNA_START=43 /DNA_END=201 /DNA_ORIENTATION=+
MSTAMKEQLESLQMMKAKMEKADEASKVSEEIIKRLSTAKDPLVKTDEVDNEW